MAPQHSRRIDKELEGIVCKNDRMTQPVLSEPAYPHRPERWEASGEILVDDGCGQELSAQLGNISEGGFMCECEQRLPVGTVVIADLPGRGPVRAEIRWVFGWRFGARILTD